MADPRLSGAFEMTPTGPRPRGANLSPLMLAKGRAHQGEKVNACPFGCDLDGLDEHGYCRHLVGFTDDRKTFEPMARKKGRRVVQVPRELVEVGTDEDGEKEFEYGPPQREKVLPADRLVQITTSYRVYRDVAEPEKKGATKKAS